MKYAIYYEGKTPDTRAAYGTINGTFELEEAIRHLDQNNADYPKFQHSLVELPAKGSPRRIQPAELAELRRPYDQTQERREAKLAGKVGK